MDQADAESPTVSFPTRLYCSINVAQFEPGLSGWTRTTKSKPNDLFNE